MYAHAGLSLCLSHIPHCWKPHVVAHIWTSLLLFREMLRPAITDLFCSGAKSIGRPIRTLNSNSKHQEVVSHYIFKESVNLHFCVYVHFFDMKTKKNGINFFGSTSIQTTIYVSEAMLNKHTTTVECTTLSYQQVPSQLYQDVCFRNCSKHTACTRSIATLVTQLCITQYYRLSRLDRQVPVFSPIYYCNSTMFISTTAKSIKLITRYEKLVPLINFSVFYNA